MQRRTFAAGLAATSLALPAWAQSPKTPAEGTEYRALLDDAQWRRASVLLAQPGATVPYVAGQLGVANPATLRALMRRRAAGL